MTVVVDKVETVVSSCPSSCLETNLANNVLVEIVPPIVNMIIMKKVEEEKGERTCGIKRKDGENTYKLIIYRVEYFIIIIFIFMFVGQVFFFK